MSTQTGTKAPVKDAPAKKASAKSAPAKKAPAKKSKVRLSLAEVMAELEAAGDAQTRKTWLRHGAKEPLFGVKFEHVKKLVKKIGVDHELALSLWATGNTDARTVAIKVIDPARVTSADLEALADDVTWSMHGTYVSQLASELSFAHEIANRWLTARPVLGWQVAGQLALRDETLPDAWFSGLLATIERTIHAAPSAEREVMNRAVIAIGSRSAELRKSALAAARRIGAIEVDHGDTACETPDAATYVEKAWAHSTSKGFESPAAHERTRELLRLRC